LCLTCPGIAAVTEAEAQSFTYTLYVQVIGQDQAIDTMQLFVAANLNQPL